MIPKDITPDLIENAIRKINGNEIPRHRTSYVYDLYFEGKKYPPKYVISIAYKLKTGKEWSSHNFNAIEAKNFFKKKGYIVKVKNINKSKKSKNKIDGKNEIKVENSQLFNKYKDVKSIRILPMSMDDTEFERDSILNVQNKYFMNNLPFKYNGIYNYKTASINEEKNSLILFQYDNKIIASALYNGMKKYDEKTSDGYNGFFIFKSNSIAIFNAIEKDEIKNIWSNFKRFSQSKQDLNKNKIHKLLQLLEEKQISFAIENYEEESYIDEIWSIADSKQQPIINDVPVNKPVKTVNYGNKKWKRVAQNGLNAIKAANYLCELNKNHKYFKANKKNNNYVEAHHLIPMEFQDSYNYSLDVEANIVSLCVFCHKLIHHGKFEDKKILLEKLFARRNKRLKKCSLNIKKNDLYTFYN